MGLGIMTWLRYNIRRMWVPRNVEFESPAVFNRNAKLDGDGHIHIGKWTRWGGNIQIICSGGKKSEICIGQNCYFNTNAIISCKERIEIGNDCMFGPNVCVFDHDHFFDSEKVYPYDFKKKSITIGNNVWIGANAIILKGSKVGDGSVIGAGTIVRGEIPPHSVVHSEHRLVIRPIV